MRERARAAKPRHALAKAFEGLCVGRGNKFQENESRQNGGGSHFVWALLGSSEPMEPLLVDSIFRIRTGSDCDRPG